MTDNIFFDLNKLFCTFTTPDELDTVLADINRRYTIMYNKIFVLESPQSKELMCTYNIDMGNTSDSPLPSTILVHRKKESNTLYTINALNELIKSLNRGVVDPSFRIDWQHYKNSILLTQHNELKTLNTKIHKIVDLV